MSERIAESNYQQLHHFIAHSQWSAEAVMQEVARKTSDSLAALSGSTGLILDESGNEKAGQKSVGVARQYIGNVGKVCNAQVGVFAALTRENRVAVVAGKLFLPKRWTDDVERMTASGVPHQEQYYRSKPELAAALIEQLPVEVEYQWIGGDTIYGNSPILREKLSSLGKAFVLDVSEQLKVYVTDPQPFVPAVLGGGRGRKPSRPVSGQTPIELKQLSAEMSAGAWRKIQYRVGTKGRLVREAVLLPVFVWTGAAATVEKLQLLISRELDKTEIKYSLCREPARELQLAEALFRQMQRYWVERAFQEIKEQLGMAQYQVRSWRAWHHHIALTMMALHFILQTQIEEREALPLLSCGDVKLMLARMLRNKLDGPEGVSQAIEVRHKQRQSDTNRRLRI
ncbi:MAG: IS701-like element ISBj6 family transposase [Pyrinomonadaceae bacterium]